MHIVDSDKIIMFDVDDTLILWHPQDYGVPGDFTLDDGTPVRPNNYAIDLLKKHYDDGYTVGVWSQGGHKWASTAVKVLQLTPYVSFVMSKPLKHVDDLNCGFWMGDRILPWAPR